MTASNVVKEEIRSKIKAQYEKFPYPAQLDNLDEYIRNKSHQFGCPSVFSHWYWPYEDENTPRDILIAGCGTSQAVKFALSNPTSSITAIDISKKSLIKTLMLSEKHSVNNIEVIELPIEAAGTLDKKFDLIVSTGVLHHLPVPEEGLKALKACLKPTGSMLLMVYGAYGREGVYHMQKIMRTLQIDPGNVTASDLSNIRELLNALPEYHPMIKMKNMIISSNSDEELVDLFLNPQDKGYSLPEVYEFTSTCDMKMQKLLMNANYSPYCAPLKNTAFYQRIKTLPKPQQQMIGELYRSAVCMHFFIACHESRSEKTYLTSIDDKGWENLVPIKSPGVVNLANRQINSVNASSLVRLPYHFSDVKALLTEVQMKLFLLIDGETDLNKLASIANNDFKMDNDEFKELLRHLEEYDIIYFKGK